MNQSPPPCVRCTFNWVSIQHAIPPCPPEGVAVSEDEEGGLTVLGTCPVKGEKGVFTHACRAKSGISYCGILGGGNAYAPTDFQTIGNAQFPTPIL